MTRVFLTGGSGFVAAHIIRLLIEHGHSVVTSVRSDEKAQAIRKAFPDATEQNLDFVIVKDVAVEGAFDEAIKSDPPFEIVIHTSSPFHNNVKDVKKDFLDPAIIGTTSLLKAIKKSSPSVKRVVITSSFASVIDSSKGNRPGYTYSEKDWNPVTEAQAIENPTQNGYRASKTFAEQASWDFVKNENPNFTLATILPPLVFGPINPHLSSLESINTSNQRIYNVAFGKQEKPELLSTTPSLWVDVRDVAQAHVAAAEAQQAADKRFFVAAGFFTNREIVDIVRKEFPKLATNLPQTDANGSSNDSTKGSEGGIYGFDNSRAREVLGIQFRGLRDSVIDTVKSLQAVS